MTRDMEPYTRAGGGELPPWLDPRATVIHAPGAPTPAPEPVGGARWLAAHAAQAWPGITTTTALILARIWHEQGAAGSTGDAALMAVMAVGSAAGGVLSAGSVHGSPALTAAGFGGAAAFALVGVAAYTESLALAFLLWLVATVTAYVATTRTRRRAREQHAERAHQLDVIGARADADLRVEAVRGMAAVEAARQLSALEQAWLHRRTLDEQPRHYPAPTIPAALPIPAAPTFKED